MRFAALICILRPYDAIPGFLRDLGVLCGSNDCDLAFLRVFAPFVVNKQRGHRRCYSAGVAGSKLS